MDGIDRHDEWSYFSAHPRTQRVRPGESSPPSSSSSRGAPPRKSRRRPPTPPFPSTTPLPPEDDQHANGQGRHISDRQAYAHFLARLRDEHRQEPPPRTRSRSNSSGAGALLRLLAQETARADAAERELAKDHEAVISRVKSIKEAQLRAEGELARVTAELALYKLQLDIAQKEILRAQTIVDDVERARAEAEERAIKDRERLRKLLLQRAVEVAREEGRQEGYRMGLQRGRWEARLNEEIDEGDMVSDEYPAAEGRRRSPSPPERSQTSPPVAAPSTLPSRDLRRSSSRAGSRKSGPSDSALGARSLSIAAPVPLRPSTSQQRGPTKESRDAPEDISRVQNTERQYMAPARSPPHSPRLESPSPSVAPSHRSRRSHYSIPPDGYIPTLGPDSHIALPPPHELSIPMDAGATDDSTTEAARAQPASSVQVNGNGEGPHKQGGARNHNRDASRDHDHSYKPPYRTRNDATADYDDVFRIRKKDGRDTPALSTVSRVSTTISQYDIVSPPKTERIREGRYGNEDRSRTPVIAYSAREELQHHPTGGKLTLPEKIVEDWRSANSDLLGTPSPQPGGQLFTRRTDAHDGAGGATSGKTRDEMGRPATAGAILNSPGPHSPRGPRHAAEAPVTPRSNPQSSVPGSYIYRTRDEHRWPGQAHSNNQPPPRPSSAANVHRQPTSSPRSRPPSGLHPSPPATQPRATVQRSTSNVTVPGIDVEPPSHSPTNSSEGTILDPVLLTPDLANRPTALPNLQPSTPSEHAEPSSHQGHPPNPVIVSQLPPGFVPLSPIPTMTNFKPEEHDPRLFEHFKGPAYQIYAGAALVPEPRIPFGPGMPSTSGSRTDSVLFSDIPRPSTAAAAMSTPEQLMIRARESRASAICLHL
ncbi:hypothetical protein LshimejAT787_0212630 [Lyophyllum shimeji]|uniref:Uncharacterized protein n=1 Tax=Lyophyllum shimeji TaxID=47721 RepID=A0A9P3PGV6_LYOSH|nr:hypothetical protein LshimejAT787_0212630 [Lyophyllum shimeji]